MHSEEILYSTTYCNTDHTWTGLGLNLGLFGERVELRDAVSGKRGKNRHVCVGLVRALVQKSCINAIFLLSTLQVMICML
jgi:hypothetical protein